MAADTLINPNRINWSKNLSTGTNITLDDGWIKGASFANGTAAQDAVTYSQATMLSTEPSVTVGPYAWCDYVTDGSADDVQIQQAITAESVKSRPRPIRLVSNLYNFSSSGQVVIPYKMILEGDGGSGGEGPINQTGCSGSVIQVYGTSVSPIVMNNGSTVRSISAWYPLQHGNATPDAYPAFISSKPGRAAHLYIRNINVGNAYIGISIIGACSVVDIQDIRGYPLFRGIDVNNILDDSVVNNINFVANYYGGSDKGTVLLTWVQENGYVISAAHCIATRFTNIGAFGYAKGFYGHEIAGNTIADNHFDGCREDIYLDATSDYNIISNNAMTCSRYFGTPLYTGTPAVYIIGNGNIITGNHLYFIQGYGIYVTGGDRNSITGNTIVRFGLVNEATCRAIYVDSTCTSTMVGGNTIDGYDLPNTQGYLDLGTSTANYNNSISRTSAG